MDTAPAGEAAGRQARNETRGTVLAHRLSVASSLWARFRGLMGRPSLPDGDGLFLTGTNGIHMLFMRFPIDAVFVGKPLPAGAWPVLSVHPGVRPWVGMVPLVRGAAGVLELPVGTIERSGTAAGDVLRLPV